MAICYIGYITCTFLCLPSCAQERRRTWHVFFNEAKTDWVPDSTLLQFAHSASIYDIRRIRVEGYASPSGRHPFNLALASSRAAMVADSLSSLFPGRAITAGGMGVDWETLSAVLGQASLPLEEQEEVLRVARSYPVSGRKRKLLLLDNGKRIYRTLFKEVFPALRRVDIVIEYEEKPLPLLLVAASDTLFQEVPLPPPRPIVMAGEIRRVEKPSDYGHRYIFALRSNTLIPLTNIGIIVPVGRHLSLGGDWYSPWFWHDRNNSWCFEFQAADIEVRYWFRPGTAKGWKGNLLTGHSIGIGAFAGHYDFEKNYTGFQGEVYGGYADYTYALNLATHFRLEFSLGVGFAQLPWREYQVYSAGGRLLRPVPVTENVKKWMGPVKAGVSVVIPISWRYKCKSHE